jgi:sterol desaturase/sphingolipid hydroxylase (fatty acid hydroxylase superfamily)
MILFDTLFKPRKLPAWWLRFTEANPIVPSIIAVAILTWICFSLAIIFSASEKHGNGKFIETVGVVSGSEPLVEKAISLRAAYHQLFPAEIRTIVNNLYCNIPLYMVVPLLLILEFLFPCNPRQPLIGKGFLQDAVWYTLFTPMTILIIFPIVEFLHGLFTRHVGFLTLGAAKSWPTYLQIIAALLLAEFFTWFNHFVRHKVRTLWYFHAVHHSQRELNIFTDDRAHMVDLLIGNLLTFIPFFIFDVSNLYAVMIIGLYKPIHNRFIHANLKINLGWLGWLVTSPQFHRVHHSSDPAHADKNFGVYFSIYDHLFGTACISRNIYPETGIEDQQFPLEEKVRVRQLPGNWLSQTMYPFRQVYDQVQSSYQMNLSRVRVALRRINGGSQEL